LALSVRTRSESVGYIKYIIYLLLWWPVWQLLRFWNNKISQWGHFVFVRSYYKCICMKTRNLLAYFSISDQPHAWRLSFLFTRGIPWMCHGEKLKYILIQILFTQIMRWFEIWPVCIKYHFFIINYYIAKFTY
jgi:hypothetical protein